MNKEVFGTCHICGKYGKLSFEHIPPKAAYNNRRIKAYTFEQIVDGKKKYRHIQQGYGEYTLCDKCNNDTGAFYGDAYVDFIKQALEIYTVSNGNIQTGERIPFNIYPLRVMKQIITIFFTVNFEVFRTNYPSLQDYVLNKDNNDLFDKRLNVYIYLIKDMFSARLTPGVVGVYNVKTNESKMFSEFAFPPIGLILTYDNVIIDRNILNINFFNSFSYTQKVSLYLPLPLLDIQNIMPGEFRTNQEIYEDNLNNLFE